MGRERACPRYFALIEKGKVLGYRDYWFAPDRTMYVEPERVLADLAAAQRLGSRR